MIATSLTYNTVAKLICWVWLQFLFGNELDQDVLLERDGMGALLGVSIIMLVYGIYLD